LQKGKNRWLEKVVEAAYPAHAEKKALGGFADATASVETFQPSRRSPIIEDNFDEEESRLATLVSCLV
jgi:hypothetical protein